MEHPRLKGAESATDAPCPFAIIEMPDWDVSGERRASVTWYDVMLLLPIAALVVFELRQEAGRGLLDATVTVAAVQLAGLYAGMVTGLLGWPPTDEGPAPGAYALCFMAFWGGGMALSRLLHRRTRWSMDQFDPLFGGIFGLVVAISFGHALAGFTASWAVSQQGQMPDYVQNSWLGAELRSFRTVHLVIETIQGYQYGSG
jgi:hypothetical protein